MANFEVSGSSLRCDFEFEILRGEERKRTLRMHAGPEDRVRVKRTSRMHPGPEDRAKYAAGVASG
jgi:hypothetical protein